MKRALLIAGGTLGSLGAVFAITPPQITSDESALATGGTFAPTGTTPAVTTTTDTGATTPTSAATATLKATAKATSKATAKATATKSAATSSGSASSGGSVVASTPTPAATKTATPTPTPTKAATSGKATSGTFTGDPSTMRYGTVQVQITISNGRITDAQAIQAPSGRDQRYTDMSVPVMRQRTLAAQSSNITGVSGASYTSYAWYVSLQSALKKAGWL